MDGRVEARDLTLEKLKVVLEREVVGRTSYLEAIILLAHLVRAELGERAGVRLAEFAIDLSDLNQGIVSETFRPAHLDNRAPESSREWYWRVQLALALECEFRFRYKRNLPIAAQSIAHLAKVDAQTLINWRKELMARRVSNELALMRFHDGLGYIADVPKEELQMTAREIVRNVNRRRLV